MAATNEQVQQYSDSRIRPLCEATQKLIIQLDDIVATISDVYDNLANSPTWTDGRTDNPPHLATPNDILAINTFVSDIRTAINNNAQLPIVKKLVVNTLV